MPNSTFWGLRWCHSNAYMPNSTFWGYRWCRIAMRTCYSALTMPLHCVNDLRTIQDGWGKSSEWVKWRGWQYQAVQDPSYMPNSTFGAWDGAVKWCKRVIVHLQCPYTVWMTSVLSKMGEGRGLSGWGNGMDDSTKPTEISTKCLIPRFWAGGGAV